MDTLGFGKTLVSFYKRRKASGGFILAMLSGRTASIEV